MISNTNTSTPTINVILPVGDDTPVIDKTLSDKTLSDKTLSDETLSDETDKNKQNSDIKLEIDNTSPDVSTDKPISDIEQIQIDGIDYNLDTDGNAINKDGSIFMTKDKIDSFTNNIDLDIISQVEKINNIIITDDNNQPIKYEPTPQGIAKRELDIISYVKENGKQEGVKSFLESNPDIKSMFEYKQKNGTLEGYGKKIDYESIQLDKTNKDQLKSFIIEEQIKKGNNINIAKSFAEFAEKNNQLDELGNIAYNSLKNAQIQERLENQTKFKKWSDSYFGVELDENGNVKDLNVPNSLYDMIIKKGEFNNLKIPKDGIVIKNNDGTTSKISGKDFFEFAAYSDENGSTKLDKLINNYLSNSANKLTIGMYILKGGDLSELANNALAKQQFKKLQISTQNNKSTSKQNNSINTNTSNKIVLPVN